MSIRKNKMLTAQEIRTKFLDFFRSKGHEIVESGPLIPVDDPSLLFTNAGMVQFKKLFLGEEKKRWTKAASCQKCLRVSGKHNDLENVGRTARHHTFFEMLGNFSFGDYFKKEAIAWAWEFVTEQLELPPEKLWVTIFRDDDEAYAIWKEVAGLPDERIVRMGEKDNFWTMGDTGPCGPCSEIYIDQGEEMACGPDCGIGKCDCDRFLEIWNLVFTQYDQSGDGSRVLLAAPNIDTGMGLERIAAICQGKQSNFDCDLFQDIIQYAAELANVAYSGSAPDANDIDTALRVIADHARAAAFLISEGVLPSNENRGYVLRRLIRRALRFAALMGVHEPFLYKVAARVTETMGSAYPELPERAEFIKRVVSEEERRFALTLDNGLKLLEEELSALERNGDRIIPGDFCFKLYDTYGFPLDIITDVAEKRGLAPDKKRFMELMNEQRTRAREVGKKSGLFGAESTSELKALRTALEERGITTEFVGYETLAVKTPLVALLDGNGALVRELGEGTTGYIVVEKTPFYAESGGQTSDHGFVRTATGKASVQGAIRLRKDLMITIVTVERGELLEGQHADLEVDGDMRKAIAANHTATHLLHAALRKILGVHVKQAGSMVNESRLRFDFSHFGALTAEELAAVEREVNRAIMSDYPVSAREMPKEQALETGAMALFDEKYGDIVRVLTIGDENLSPESVELCGGTHLKRTGEAGSFYIVSENAVASGVRRIEAVTGWQAYNASIRNRGDLRQIAAGLKSAPDQILERIGALQEELRGLKKTLEKNLASSGEQALNGKMEDVGGIRVLTSVFKNAPIKALREVMDGLRGKYPEKAVICLAAEDGSKVNLLLYVSKDLHQQFTAPELIRSVAEACGGSGGGRPDLAQAGGSNPDGVETGFKNLKRIIAEKK